MTDDLHGTIFGSEDPMRAALVASTGGHLAQLVRFATRLRLTPESTWFTFDSPQSRSLLEGRNVVYLPYMPPRGYSQLPQVYRQVRHELAQGRYDHMISTGAGVALGAFAAAASARVPRTYIESVSRVAGPSLTGRIVAASRMASLRTQHPAWATDRWRVIPSVLSTFATTPRVPVAEAPLKVLVTLGTIRPYRFDLLVDQLLATGEMGADTLWQLGETVRDVPVGSAASQMSAQEFTQAARDADVVVTHAGVGTIIGLLEMGICPVVVPRSSARGEHVDDHQSQIAALLRTSGVGVVCEADELSSEHLWAAAGRRTVVEA